MKFSALMLLPATIAALAAIPAVATPETRISRPIAGHHAGTGGEKEQRRKCRLEVDGKIEVAGACWVSPMGGEDFTLNTWDHGKPRNSHFAMISANNDGTANATWNADPNDDRAFDKLGVVRKQKGCWVNKRARICAL